MRYVMWLPINASAKFVLETDKELTDAEVREEMLKRGEADGSLCHHCSHCIETDLDMAYSNCADDIEQFEVSREG